MPATRWPARARESAAAVGLGLVVLTAVIYDAGTAFPGWRAALPVAATALVIAAAPRAGDGPVGRALARRPVQSVGDLSYSIYLWHWPLIVLVAYRTGGLGVLDDLAVIVASVFLAALTKRFVEDPFRRPRRTHPTARALLLGAGGMAVVVGLAGAQLVEVHHRDDRAEARVLSAVANAGPCFGAAALSHAGCPLTLRAPVVPGPAAAARDWSDAWAEPKQAGVNCFAYPQLYASRGCTFGDPRGHISVALAGNSHAAHLLPALEVLAKVEHWRITTFLAGGCALSDTAQVMGNTEANASCADWVHRTVGQISAGHFDLVVMANRMYPVHPGTEQVGAYREGYRRVLGEFSRAHLRVLALHDTPAPIDGGLLSVPDCLASHPTDYRPCTGNRGWIPPDPVGEAVLAVHDRRISMLDLNDHICGRRECAGAVGGVVVYFDGLHLTATFARTLAPYLNLPIRRALHTP
jgi:hypothetical protein